MHYLVAFVGITAVGLLWNKSNKYLFLKLNMNEEINIIFPNQLFQNSEIIQNKKDTYIIEENLFFNQYKFHKHKIAYHRSSMQKYKDYLISKDINVIYIDSQDKLSDIRNFIKQNYKNLKKINLYDPVDIGC